MPRIQPLGWRALSVRQPWAWALVSGHKPVENRDWRTDYRGPLVIHSGKVLGCEPHNFLGECDEVAYRCRLETLPPEASLAGGLVGFVQLTKCVERYPSPWFKGLFGFVVEPLEQWPLIPWQGQRGIWELTEDECHDICVRLEAAGTDSSRSAATIIL